LQESCCYSLIMKRSVSNQMDLHRREMVVLPKRAVQLLCLLGFVAALSPFSPWTFLVAQQSGVAAAEVQTHLRAAQMALGQNQTTEAENEFRAVIALVPNNVEANANLGVLAFFRGSCPDADRYLRTALASNPSLDKQRALLGICEKRAGNPAALDDLQRSFARLPDPNMRVRVGMELSDLYYEQGNLEEVLSVIHGLLAVKPDDVDLLFFAQRIYSEMADATLNRLAVLAPESARMQQVIAEHLVNAGDLPDAIIHYRKATGIDPRLPGMHFELAEALMQSPPSNPNALAEAEKELQVALEIDGDSAKVEAKLGEIAYQRSSEISALKFYERAYQLNPKSPDALLGLALIEMQRKRPQQAAHYLRSAVEVDPLNAAAHYRLALAYRELHQMDAMKQQMQLFQNIKQTEARVVSLYQEMHKTPASSRDEGPDAQKK
jgi:tetratricopeptide (TPR) repeat protein